MKKINFTLLISIFTFTFIVYTYWKDSEKVTEVENNKINLIVKAVISSYEDNNKVFSFYENTTEDTIVKDKFKSPTTEYIENILSNQSELIHKCGLFTDLFKLKSLLVDYHTNIHHQQMKFNEIFNTMTSGYVGYSVIPRQSSDTIFLKYKKVSSSLLNCISKHFPTNPIKMSDHKTLTLIKEFKPAAFAK